MKDDQMNEPLGAAVGPYNTIIALFVVKTQTSSYRPCLIIIQDRFEISQKEYESHMANHSLL